MLTILIALTCLVIIATLAAELFCWLLGLAVWCVFALVGAVGLCLGAGFIELLVSHTTTVWHWLGTALVTCVHYLF